ncbi:GNAT family N-acetyltransferase [Paenibacillus lutimineralis]|uniref:GNAT family N-acetyltransferase n=1 Tax=Paenibacillus lutimineralis TaxID=2707005 RepID=A0A3Q9ICN9_9BACL|nr:GNAT family N-acetyltransferase [Paenibacillus lutimineralis]AZS15199.1 GNAT family N-acetyltransferase [Paenibacillus lutimineralis]
MDTKYSVAQATHQDLDDLVLLFDLYRVFYQQPSNLEGARAFLFERFNHAESVIFIARNASNGQAAGFAQLYPTFSSISMQRSWVLNDLYVREESRREGVGELLLKHVKEFAVLTKAKGIALSTALNNIKAQSLYEKEGYVKDNEFYNYFLTLEQNGLKAKSHLEKSKKRAGAKR